jgi:protein O-GlcNAc transferase
LRARVEANRATAPLFDTERFTRNFETAIEMMVQQHAVGASPAHIDVPDCGPLEPRSEPVAMAPAAAALRQPYGACPLCDGASVTLGFANCSGHALWHEPLPPTIEWMRCASCAHVHSRSYWTAAGRLEVQRRDKSAEPTAAANLAARRAVWVPVLERAVGALGGYAAIQKSEGRPVWVDVGCGDGTLVMSAADYGFSAVGLETRAEVVRRTRELGFTALQHDFMELRFEVTVDVLSMMDVLEQLPDPRAALRKAAQVLRPGSLLLISTADLASSSWRLMEHEKANPYWTDLERHHNFSRERLTSLLKESGFEVVAFAIPNRRQAQMELYARRKDGDAST